VNRINHLPHVMTLDPRCLANAADTDMTSCSHLSMKREWPLHRHSVASLEFILVRGGHATTPWSIRNDKTAEAWWDHAVFAEKWPNVTTFSTIRLITKFLRGPLDFGTQKLRWGGFKLPSRRYISKRCKSLGHN